MNDYLGDDPSNFSLRSSSKGRVKGSIDSMRVSGAKKFHKPSSHEASLGMLV
jgi:hypothetical protein